MNNTVENITFPESGSRSFWDHVSYSEDYIDTNQSYLTNTTYTQSVDYLVDIDKTEYIIPTWSNIWAHIVVIVSPLTMAGNALVLATIFRSRNLRNSVNNLFVANLAAADFCFGAFVVSLMGEWTLTMRWRHGDIPCRLILWAEITINAISNNALACLSFSKFLYVIYPFHFDRWMNQAAMTTLIGICWLYPMVLTLPAFLAQQPNLVLYYSREDCEYVLSQIYMICGSFLLFVLPLLLVIVFGVRVLLIARHHRKKIACMEMLSENLSLKRSSWKALRSFLLVVLVYLLLQGPLYAGAFIQAACRCVPYIWFYEYLGYPFWLSGMVNPIIYFFSEKYYRKSFYRLVTCGRYRPPDVGSLQSDNSTTATA